MFNASPIEVSFHWSFALNDQPVAAFRQLPNVMETKEMVIEDVSFDSIKRDKEIDNAVQGAVLPAVEVNITVEGLADSPRLSTLHEVVYISVCRFMVYSL